jgi:hypothetical protein
MKIGQPKLSERVKKVGCLLHLPIFERGMLQEQIFARLLMLIPWKKPLLFNELYPAILRLPFLCIVRGYRSEWANPVGFQTGTGNPIFTRQGLYHGIRPVLGELHVRVYTGCCPNKP